MYCIYKAMIYLIFFPQVTFPIASHCYPSRYDEQRLVGNQVEMWAEREWSFRQCHVFKNSRDIEAFDEAFDMYPVSVCTLRIQICPKNIGFPRSDPMGMELWNNQSY